MECEDIVSLACEELGISGTGYDVHVEFEIMQDGEFGFSHMADDETFEISINRNIPVEEIIKTLLHEMVHVKQQIEGSYTVDWFGSCWNGTYMNVPYNERPWENEAHAYESVLFDKVISYNNMENKIWKIKKKSLKVVI